jgi:quercetin dioxygenase-like cupin family protein
MSNSSSKDTALITGASRGIGAVYAHPGTAAHKDVFNASGVLLEFLASPEEVKDSICFIRGMMPPGIVVPLYRHEEPELLYVLAGSLEVYRSGGPSGSRLCAG